MMNGVVRDAPRVSGQVGLLRAVHDHQGSTRAAVARELGMTSGFAAETIARLTARQLLIERPAPPSGVRGRPTMSLHPHPDGPLVAIAAVAHEAWEVAAMQLGGAKLESVKRHHRRDRRAVLAAVAAELARVEHRYRDRIRAAAVSVPGTVIGKILAQAPNLGWHDVDLSALWPDGGTDRPLLTGNDATFAAIAESRRGAAMGGGTTLHVYMDAGVGGAIMDGDRVLLGASGMAGEFGHMPFGDLSQRCRCGAMGCWNTSLDGMALATMLHRRAPADEVSYTRNVIAAARDGGADELEAIRTVGRSFGRGVAGLVNALDPGIVTIGGLGRDLLDVAGEHVKHTYLDGLMKFRTAPAPALTPAHFGDDAPLIGAAEDAFSVVLTDEGLRAWSSRG
jgi:predicted NBD/HSP70 family sugar kinase